MLIFHFVLTETFRTQVVLYRSVSAMDFDEALEMLRDEFPWFNLLGFDVIDGKR